MATEESKPATPDKPTPPEKAAAREAAPKTKADPPRRRSGRVVALGAAVALAALFVVVPFVTREMNSVSTDDAYVNGYVTFVAARVPGQVARVLVDDNNRVKKGDVLVELDPEPYRVQVAIKQASVNAARSELAVAEATARGLAAQARSQRFKLMHAMEEVDNQVALVRERAAKWEQAKATQVLAQSEYDRAAKLLPTKAVSTQEVEEKLTALNVAKTQVTQTLENTCEARVALGLPGKPPEGTNLTDVPEDLSQNVSSVREALAELIHSVAQLGVSPTSYNLTPKQTIEAFLKRDPSGDIDRILADLVKNAPGVKRAQAALALTQRDLDQANLDLRYCTITSEIDGVVTRRNVNPGNNVQVGQSLMAIRSLTDIWVDANFKETQLRDLRIGQRVELETDIYGSHRTFEGRISGFTMGTGSTLALLPAQNATGNFVKVVQRLPVRIDVVNYDPDKFPLFIGLSVTPTVDLRTAPTGPNAGKFLQGPIEEPSPAVNSPAPKP